jgi:hypothetical protein
MQGVTHHNHNAQGKSTMVTGASKTHDEVGTAVLGTAILVALLTCAVGPQAGSGSAGTALAPLRTDRLEIVDSQGRVRIRLRCDPRDEDAPLVELLDAHERPRAAIKEDGGGYFVLLDEAGRLRASLAESGSGGALTLMTAEASPFRAAAQVMKGRSSATLQMSTEGKSFFVQHDPALDADAPSKGAGEDKSK